MTRLEKVVAGSVGFGGAVAALAGADVVFFDCQIRDCLLACYYAVVDRAAGFGEHYDALRYYAAGIGIAGSARRAAALAARGAERSCNGSPLAFRLTLPEAESQLGDDEANEWAAMERRADALARLIEAERGAEAGSVFVEADNVNLYAYAYRNAREAERQLSTGGGDHVATFGSGEGWDWLQDGVAREAAFFTVWRAEASAATAQS